MDTQSPATHYTQSLLAERFFVAATAHVLDGVEPSLVPRHRALLDCIQLHGINHWLLAVLISGLQHYRARLQYCLCMQTLAVDSICMGYRAWMDPYGDHALLCHGDSHSSGFQLCHRLVQ